MAALLAVAAAAVLVFSGGFLLQRTLLEPQGEYSRITQAADVERVRADVSGGGTATVYWSRTEHRTAVVLNGVAPPSGRVLQLWSIRGDTVTSAGLYQPQGGDRYALLAGTPSSGEQLAVSVEPAGGSPQPTTKPIVVVPLKA
jgi:anti-sigma-K factor RskA